jgi:glycine/D-amino acid oxidase-like deaminating enzyme
MNLKTGLPYALIKNGLVAEYPKLLANKKTDVVIMGGGISGALTAYHMVSKGISCMVVDARSIGLGSSCASTSLLQYEIDIPLHKLAHQIGEAKATRCYKLCEQAIEKLFTIANTIGFTDIQHKKSCYYAAAKKDTAMLQQEFTMRKKAGFKVRWLDEKELLKKVAFTAPAAILSKTGAQTNAYMFTHALHQYAIRKGAEVYDRTEITAIEHKTKGVVLKTKEGFTIHSKKLVYATGYEVVKYIKKPFVKLQTTFAVISEPLYVKRPYWSEDMLLWNTANPYLYLRTTTDNRILIGGRDDNFYTPIIREDRLASKSKDLVKDFKKLFPEIPFVAEFSWAGTFGSTHDALPFIGTYHKLPNSYFALGFGGNGITFSLIAAEIIVAHLTGKNNPDAGLFSFERL